MVINTTAGAQSLKDSFDIRRTALMRTIPHYTTLQGARAAVKAIAALKRERLDVKPLQSYFQD
jgi:carbamoyl-phosphate synthase large subunit